MVQCKTNLVNFETDETDYERRCRCYGGDDLASDQFTLQHKLTHDRNHNSKGSAI